MTAQLITLTPAMARSIEEMQLLQITLTDEQQRALMKMSQTPPLASNPNLQRIVNSAHGILIQLLSCYCTALDTSILTLNHALEVIDKDREGLSERAVATLDTLEIVVGPIQTEFHNIRAQITSLESRLLSLAQLGTSFGSSS